ncbi:hypothetical protein Lfu02_68220 [Longispora fulva]|uniref:Uncharacterized protein n=1 Tax=Longispora fulva TaxID=619741 RepID=A0A8J7G6Y0_9ACTN|nr:hypothetical protein [Longispora fulva]MBG6134075.1 hypothetical protein [Longispora fulva]GIG62450.1 hypothetical protein Lfu02_68220 [Longispora fulva]
MARTPLGTRTCPLTGVTLLAGAATSAFQPNGTYRRSTVSGTHKADSGAGGYTLAVTRP